MPVSPATSHLMASNYSVFFGTLNFKWGPHDDEPTLIADQITRIGFELKDFTLPMLASKEIVVADMERRFAGEMDLNERPWKKRSKATIAYYKRHGMSYTTILRKDNDLFEAVTDRNSYPVVDDDMFIDTSSWPEYWHAHDQGSTVGRGIKLPKRQYVGVSERAQFEITDIFDGYLGSVLDIVPPGASGIPMHRGAFGHIAGKFTAGMARPRILPIVPGIVSAPSE